MAIPALRDVPADQWADAIARVAASGLAGHLGVRGVELRPGLSVVRLELTDAHLLVAGGLTHGGTVLALADTCAGWGAIASIPDGTGMTTLEAKINMVATARAGDVLVARGELTHGGRTTQVWDVTVRRERDDRVVALYRCTQALLPEARS